MRAPYSIILFCDGGESAGIECALGQYRNLAIASALFEEKIKEYHGRLLMLCDGARVLARNDRPETMPWARGRQIVP